MVFFNGKVQVNGFCRSPFLKLAISASYFSPTLFLLSVLLTIFTAILSLIFEKIESQTKKGERN